ncbi:uncharacterized protein LOC119284146 [Triticum dicoccoides]|uniref:uncharacterized protein LOC119284146 n=1 Tax=Triticum dicoccoides TaxID=85692 RepID=UPI0018908FC1|nr:uncharacterized protein LOC119284146 [Triticum dicoccoides]
MRGAAGCRVVATGHAHKDGVARVLENACWDNEEMRAILGDSIGNPELITGNFWQHQFIASTKGYRVTLDHIFGVEPTKITSPSTDSEIALALRVLEGCCLLYSRCTALAHKYKAVQVLLNILASRGPTAQGVCLDALISLMLDSPSNQIDFEEYSGLEKVAELLKDVQVEEHIRLKCGEFLLLLIGHVYVKENTPIVPYMNR